MLHLIMSVVVSWWGIPRVGRLCDQRVSRQRFHVRHAQVDLPMIQRQVSQGGDAAEVFELLAIKIRGGVNARHALELLADANVIPVKLRDAVRQHPALSLQQVLTHFYETASTETDSFIGALLLQAYRQQSLQPAALDMAAHIIRDKRMRSHRIRVATAHARLTLRILSVLPIGALVAGIVFSSAVRKSMNHVAPLIFVLLGLLLDAGAWLWMRNIAVSIEKSAKPSELHQLLTSVSVSVTAGDSLVDALQRCATSNSLGASISQALAQGSPLSDALKHLDKTNSSLGPATKRLLLDSHQSGTPVMEVIHRLLDDAEAETTRQSDISIQQLSTKLTLPTVFCVLPAFLLLALMPVALASFEALPTAPIT